jgi:hypothetical protein
MMSVSQRLRLPRTISMCRSLSALPARNTPRVLRQAQARFGACPDDGAG